MMVFAASIVREKHRASIPGRSAEPSYGPTNAHSGIGTVSHMDWKLPKDIAATAAAGGRGAEVLSGGGRERAMLRLRGEACNDGCSPFVVR